MNKYDYETEEGWSGSQYKENDYGGGHPKHYKQTRYISAAEISFWALLIALATIFLG